MTKVFKFIGVNRHHHNAEFLTQLTFPNKFKAITFHKMFLNGYDSYMSSSDNKIP